MARKRNGILNGADLWQKYVDNYLDVFIRALDKLDITEDQRKKENMISQILHPILQNICQKYHNDLPTPIWEAPHQSMSNEELISTKAPSRPDFTCIMVDSFADTPDMYEIYLHIECKRLGQSGTSWNLNREYCINGIMRFDSPVSQYGKNAHSGIMVGYIVNSTKSDILADVNKNLPLNIEKLVFLTNNIVETVRTKYNRQSIVPFDFTLYHIWADLRSRKYTQEMMPDNISRQTEGCIKV
jgi:hypothetical protein